MRFPGTLPTLIKPLQPKSTSKLSPSSLGFVGFPSIFPSDALRKESTCIVFRSAVQTRKCYICTCKGISLVLQGWESERHKTVKPQVPLFVQKQFKCEEETHLRHPVASKEVRGSMTHPVSTTPFPVTLKKIFKLLSVCKATYLHSQFSCFPLRSNRFMCERTTCT